jgi:GNAT superfamily N-acetyltransferase
MTVRRPGSPADWARVRELCCLTGNAGDPVARERWEAYGEFWIGPYERFLPGWTYVVEDEGRIEGYLTGCPDTARFLRRRTVHDLVLRARLASGRFGASDADRAYFRRALRLETRPGLLFPREVARALTRDFPGHLHVNVDARLRGRGAGQRLLEAFLADLSSAGVRGVHLLCGPKPLAFYERAGFRELAVAYPRPETPVHALARRT